MLDRGNPETFLDGRVTLHCGDVRAVLATLPDDHFDCVVTSPPYWGLRDYGTARWEGGDPACDHRSPTMREGRNEDRAKLKGSAATNSYQNILAHHSGCGKCGAIKIDNQLGLERTLGEHLSVMVEVFREVRRVLKPTGTCWINYGDCYATAPNGRSAADTKAAGNDDRTFRDKPFSTVGAIYDPERENGFRVGKSGNKGSTAADNRGRVVAGGFLKPKDLCMVPNRLAIALQDDGWWIRSEIIWHKPNPMPESTRDRPTSSHEKIWLLTKRERYFYDADAIAEPVTQSTVERVSQPTWDQQAGSTRQPGKTNGAMKAVVKRSGNKARKYGDDADRPGSHLGRSIPWEGSTRNSRNVWTMGTAAFSDAHFATFPPELAERCIKAGSSEAGCCTKCGLPWVRLVERTDVLDATAKGSRFDNGKTASRTGGDRTQRGERYRKVATGWQPSCSCDADVQPARVLDIFGGAGTTGLVAASLGRTAMLIELNPEYCRLARARIEAAFMGKEEGARHMAKTLGKVEPPGPLFAELAP